MATRNLKSLFRNRFTFQLENNQTNIKNTGIKMDIVVLFLYYILFFYSKPILLSITFTY